MHIPVGNRLLGSLALGLAVALPLSLPAGAHGPTVKIAYAGPRPTQIVIAVGQTLHFQNISSTPRTFTLVAEDGSFESPALPRGEGWHHTFEAAGSFAYFVREYPDRKGVVVVAPAE